MRAASVVLLLCSLASGAEVIPGSAEKAKEESREPPPVGGTVVVGERPIHEEDRVGENNQPEWSTQRRFPTTRVYVAPAGSASLEFWLNTKHPLNDLGGSRFRTTYEAEFGLGHRLQLDLYLETEQEGPGPFELKREKIELRYALAKWGVIPGNPTLYAEAVREFDGPVNGEFKVLFGGQVRPRLHWGANVIWERTFDATQLNEYALAGGLAWTIIDEKLSLGVEGQIEMTDVKRSRFHLDSVEPLIGPSLMFRFHPRASLMVVALAGAEFAGGKTTPLLEPTLIFDWRL
ncbi:MAG: hypothetical protein ACJ790_04995 [Myxococcaceae bacterium]